MSRKHLVSGALIALISFFLFGAVVAAIPAQQSAITSDQALFATLDFKNTQDTANRALDADQSTQIAQLWLTVDSQQIATLVATFTSTGIATITPSVFASPTQEILTTPFSATPTFQSVTNSPTPTRSPTPILIVTSTSTPTPLPAIVIATNVSGSNLRIRSTCSLSGEILGYVYTVDRPETPYMDNQVAVDITQMSELDGYGWISLWNGGGCVAHERISPYLMMLNW